MTPVWEMVSFGDLIWRPGGGYTSSIGGHLLRFRQALLLIWWRVWDVWWGVPCQCRPLSRRNQNLKRHYRRLAIELLGQ